MTPLELHGSPVYIGSDSTFLYVNKEQRWVVGPIGGKTIMQNLEDDASRTVPSMDWQFRDAGGDWCDDDQLLGIPQKGL